jgi:hypothetical protein
MKSARSLVLCALFLAACSNSPTGDDDDDTDDSFEPGGATFQIYTLDADTDDQLLQFAMAVGPDNTVGVSYYKKTSDVYQNQPLYEIRYLEWSAGTVSQTAVLPTAPSGGGTPHDDKVAVRSNLAVTFATAGQPVVGFLGGFDPSSPLVGGNTFWFQNDAYVAVRTSGNWTQRMVADQATAPSTLGGSIIGFDPALTSANGTVYFAYRVLHNGQFPTDYSGSDLMLSTSANPASSWAAPEAVVLGADTQGTQNKVGYGSHSKIAFVNNAAVILGDTQPNTWDSYGINVVLFKKTSGTYKAFKPFTSVIGNTMTTGPSFAHDAQLGYALAVGDRSDNTMYFASSANGEQWSSIRVWASGTGGWYPSLGVHPSTHKPHIAFYYCDDRKSIGEDSCRTADDELRILSNFQGQSRIVDVADAEGGYAPLLGFLSNGKRVVVYKAPKAAGSSKVGVLKIAVEQ